MNTPNFPENCMKSKEFGCPGGACVPHAPPRSANVVSSLVCGSNIWEKTVFQTKTAVTESLSVFRNLDQMSETMLKWSIISNLTERGKNYKDFINTRCIISNFYRRKRSLGQGNIFIGVSRILFTGGGLRQCMLGCHPSGSRHPPHREQTPLPPAAHPPGSAHPREQTPPRSTAFCEIRSTRGRYASYWNAFLLIYLIRFFCNLCKFH